MHKEWGPAHHERSEEDGKGQGPSHAVAPPPPSPSPPPTPTRPTPASGQSSNVPGMYAGQHEHVGVDQVDDHQGDDEEDHEADHDDVGIEEPYHEHRRDAARCPDDAQDGGRAPHRHDVVVAQGVEYGDVTGMDKNDRLESN